MLSKVHDDEERIIGYIEWWQVTQSGYQEPYGEYVWVRDMWIHPEYRRGKEIFKELIQDILWRAREAKFGYFNRRKYRGRLSKLYTRNDWEKWVNGK